MHIVESFDIFLKSKACFLKAKDGTVRNSVVRIRGSNAHYDNLN